MPGESIDAANPLSYFIGMAYHHYARAQVAKAEAERLREENARVGCETSCGDISPCECRERATDLIAERRDGGRGMKLVQFNVSLHPQDAHEIKQAALDSGLRFPDFLCQQILGRPSRPRGRVMALEAEVAALRGRLEELEGED